MKTPPSTFVELDLKIAATTLPLSDEIGDGCRTSTLWSYRALGTAVALLKLDDAAFAKAMGDKERAIVFVQVAKMAMWDEVFERFRARVREMVADRVISAVVRLDTPELNAALKEPIDFKVLPPVPGASFEDANSVRCA